MAYGRNGQLEEACESIQGYRFPVGVISWAISNEVLVATEIPVCTGNIQVGFLVKKGKYPAALISDTHLLIGCVEICTELLPSGPNYSYAFKFASIPHVCERHTFDNLIAKC